MNDILSQQDVDKLFSPLYEEYYMPRTSEVSDNSAINTLDNEDIPSSSSIIVDDNDALQLVSSSEESIAQESSTSVLDTHSDEQIQEDVAELDGNTIMHSFEILEFEEMHPIEQVIGDPSKPIQTRSRLRTDAELCMYALTMDVKTAFLNGPLKEEVFNIPCPMECKIVGQILIDHALSYALTATTDVPAVYIQQFWNTVKQMPNANNTIRFTIDREKITYIVDMFCDTLQLPVETLDHPFIKTADLKFIQRFLKIVGYKGIVDKRLDENYHFIKDNIQLVSVYTTGNVTVKGMLIPDEFLTNDICATMKYKEYEKVFGRVDIPTIQPQPVKSTQRTNRIPSATRTPTPTAIEKKKQKQVVGENSIPRKSLKSHNEQNCYCCWGIRECCKVKDKILEEDIAKMVDGKKEDFYASAFADLVFQNEEDIKTKIAPGSNKEHPKTLEDNDDNGIETEKKDDEKDDDVGHNVDTEMVNDDVEKKDDTMDDKKDDEDNYNDHDYHALVKNKVLGSMETRNE
uniref:Reverse transcriptase Ty1/copia-type domain-containing protein n=1 Tax=Tanacetum cinerariifolium TaxID=118510 RepID=A0A6L2KMP3_TANCI|nr:hypothetical protein [Tanacetum cinerariifolium]GEU52819.1 hypothetical protein [Tanacetum cinerariifolium]